MTLYLKQDAIEFLDQDKLFEVATKYSEFVNFPIYLHMEKTTTKQIPVDEEEKLDIDKDTKDEKKDGEEENKIEVEEDVEADKKKEPKFKTERIKEWKYEKVNSNSPIWLRTKEDITNEE